MPRHCVATTKTGRRCKGSVHKDGFCWVHSEKEMNTCGICLDESIKNSKYNLVLQCGHVYCLECISTWIIEQIEIATCPMCRADIGLIDFSKARRWALNTGYLFYGYIVYYRLSCVGDTERKYLEDYDIMPGTTVSNNGFKPIFEKISTNEQATTIFKKLERSQFVKSFLFKRSDEPFDTVYTFIN